MKRGGPPLVSAARRVRATKARRRLANRAIDIDARGRVVGFVSHKDSRRELERGTPADITLAGAGDDVDANLRRRGPGIYPDRGDLDAVARWIADIALVPIEIVVSIIRKLEGMPKAIAVGLVLYELTKREHNARAQARPRKRR